MNPTTHSPPMAPPAPHTADPPPPEPAPAEPPPAATDAAEADAEAADAEAQTSSDTLRRAIWAKTRKIAENAFTVLLVVTLLGVAPVVVTLMIYTLNSFGARIDDTNAHIVRLENTMDARFIRLEDKMDTRFAAQDAKMDARFAAQDAKMDARFAAQDAKIAQLSRDVAQVSRDITQVLALLLAQNTASPAPSASLAPAAP